MVSVVVPEQWCDIAYVRDAGVLKAEGAGLDVGLMWTADP